MWGKPFFFYQKAKIIERIYSSFQIQLNWKVLKKPQWTKLRNNPMLFEFPEFSRACD